MATVTGLTAERMLEIEGATVVSGAIVNSHLILTKFDGTTVDTGALPPGPQGPAGPSGSNSIPGEIKAWPGSVLPSQGLYGKWVWADGAIYSAATYPIAASHIHVNWRTAFGQSDPGGGNFRVPDLRGLVLAGLDQMPAGARANRMTRSVAITIAAKTGEETHIITIPEMPAHGHTVTDPGHVHPLLSRGSQGNSGSVPTIGGASDVPNNSYPNAVGNAVTGITIANAGGGSGHENVQPTVFVPYIVRLDG
jgi:microcystin-dependent protein